MGSSPTSSPTLVMVKHGTMTVTSTSRTKRMDTLSTSVVIEDRSEDVGHDDEKLMREAPVKVGELTDPMAGVISLDW